RCSNPSVRREWRSLAPEERAEWIAAVKCLNTLPHDSSLVPTFNTTYTAIPPINTSSSYFDDWVYVHMDLNPVIHYTGQFLPWHRAYVKDFETALQEKCGYSGTQPYWDWTLDASNFENSTFWDPDVTTGVGGWGDPNDDHQITTGGFAYDFPLSYPSPHRLRRQYTPTTPGRPNALDLITPENQEVMVNDFVGNFIGFQEHFEGGSHGAIHRIVGGDLLGNCPISAPAGCAPGPKWSPNDPLFMMHHGMVDKLWYDWQNANPANFWSFDGGSVSVVNNFIPDPAFPNGAPPFVTFATPIPTDGIMNKYTIYELMDTQNKRLCYIYE
ncbi:Di-copper centre-containing protein, partial [Thelephora ganbajun]